MKGRKSTGEILDINSKIIENPLLKTILQYVPVFVGVLTVERQFVLVNEKFFTGIGFDEAADGLGLRPGEVFGCIHQNDVPGGCGEGPACRYCGAVQLVFKAISTGEAQKGEARLSTERDGDISAWDLLINVEPVEMEGQQFFILFMQDISSEKYRTMMERVFFHDVLNSATSLDSLVNLLHPDAEEKDPDGFVGMLRSRVNDVVEQINFHRKLLNAEKGALIPQIEAVELKGELEDLILTERQIVNLNGGKMSFSLEGERVWMKGDRVILRRIFLNLLKNAREASSGEETISVRMLNEGGRVLVGVHNPAVMPSDVRSQVFQRSFSTKGAGRGLGTYSIKLLTTRYLNGDISFRSEEGFGTEFVVDLPRL